MTTTTTPTDRHLATGSWLMGFGAVAFIGYAVVFFILNFTDRFLELGIGPKQVDVGRAEIQAFSPSLFHYISHLHIAVAGFIAATGLAVLYLVITVAAIVAHGVVPGSLFVAGDAAATANNIGASESLLRFGGIGSELVILLSEIVLSVLLYVLLRPVNKTLSLLAAVSRLAMTTIHGLNLLNYFLVLQLLGGTGYLAVRCA